MRDRRPESSRLLLTMVTCSRLLSRFGPRLEDAKKKLVYADAQLLELDALTSVLAGPGQAQRQRQDVARVRLPRLARFRPPIRTSINEGGRLTGRLRDLVARTRYRSDPHLLSRRPQCRSQGSF